MQNQKDEWQRFAAELTKDIRDWVLSAALIAIAGIVLCMIGAAVFSQLAAQGA